MGRRIAEATGRTDYAWEFKVLEDKQANAFCLPDGKVTVYDPRTVQAVTALPGAGASVGVLLPWSRRRSRKPIGWA